MWNDLTNRNVGAKLFELRKEALRSAMETGPAGLAHGVTWEPALNLRRFSAGCFTLSIRLAIRFDDFQLAF